VLLLEITYTHLMSASLPTEEVGSVSSGPLKFSNPSSSRHERTTKGCLGPTSLLLYSGGRWARLPECIRIGIALVRGSSHSGCLQAPSSRRAGTTSRWAQNLRIIDALVHQKRLDGMSSTVIIIAPRNGKGDPRVRCQEGINSKLINWYMIHY
jgi:hypothetical protein